MVRRLVGTIKSCPESVCCTECSCHMRMPGASSTVTDLWESEPRSKAEDEVGRASAVSVVKACAPNSQVDGISAAFISATTSRGCGGPRPSSDASSDVISKLGMVHVSAV